MTRRLAQGYPPDRVERSTRTPEAAERGVTPIKAETVTRTFATFGTGHQLPSNLNDDFSYVGTYQTEPFVWHVFEEKL